MGREREVKQSKKERVSPEMLKDLILLYLYASPRGESRSILHLETALKHIIKALKGEEG